MKTIKELEKEIEELEVIGKKLEKEDIYSGDLIRLHTKIKELNIELKTLQEVCDEIEKKTKEYDKHYFKARKDNDKQAEDIFYNTISNFKELLNKLQGDTQ